MATENTPNPTVMTSAPTLTQMASLDTGPVVLDICKDSYNMTSTPVPVLLVKHGVKIHTQSMPTSFVTSQPKDSLGTMYTTTSTSSVRNLVSSNGCMSNLDVIQSSTSRTRTDANKSVTQSPSVFQSSMSNNVTTSSESIPQSESQCFQIMSEQISPSAGTKLTKNVSSDDKNSKNAIDAVARMRSSHASSTPTVRQLIENRKNTVERIVVKPSAMVNTSFPSNSETSCANTIAASTTAFSVLNPTTAKSANSFILTSSGIISSSATTTTNTSVSSNTTNFPTKKKTSSGGKLLQLTTTTKTPVGTVVHRTNNPVPNLVGPFYLIPTSTKGTSSGSSYILSTTRTSSLPQVAASNQASNPVSIPASNPAILRPLKAPQNEGGFPIMNLQSGTSPALAPGSVKKLVFVNLPTSVVSKIDGIPSSGQWAVAPHLTTMSGSNRDQTSLVSSVISTCSRNQQVQNPVTVVNNYSTTSSGQIAATSSNSSLPSIIRTIYAPINMPACTASSVHANTTPLPLPNVIASRRLPTCTVVTNSAASSLLPTMNTFSKPTDTVPCISSVNARSLPTLNVTSMQPSSFASSVSVNKSVAPLPTANAPSTLPTNTAASVSDNNKLPTRTSTSFPANASVMLSPISNVVSTNPTVTSARTCSSDVLTSLKKYKVLCSSSTSGIILQAISDTTSTAPGSSSNLSPSRILILPSQGQASNPAPVPGNAAVPSSLSAYTSVPRLIVPTSNSSTSMLQGQTLSNTASKAGANPEFSLVIQASANNIVLPSASTSISVSSAQPSKTVPARANSKLAAFLSSISLENDTNKAKSSSPAPVFKTPLNTIQTNAVNTFAASTSKTTASNTTQTNVLSNSSAATVSNIAPQLSKSVIRMQNPYMNKPSIKIFKGVTPGSTKPEVPKAPPLQASFAVKAPDGTMTRKKMLLYQKPCYNNLPSASQNVSPKDVVVENSTKRGFMSKDKYRVEMPPFSRVIESSSKEDVQAVLTRMMQGLSSQDDGHSQSLMSSELVRSQTRTVLPSKCTTSTKQKKNDALVKSLQRTASSSNNLREMSNASVISSQDTFSRSQDAVSNKYIEYDDDVSQFEETATKAFSDLSDDVKKLMDECKSCRVLVVNYPFKRYGPCKTTLKVKTALHQERFLKCTKRCKANHIRRIFKKKPDHLKPVTIWKRLKIDTLRKARSLLEKTAKATTEVSSIGSTKPAQTALRVPLIMTSLLTGKPLTTFASTSTNMLTSLPPNQLQNQLGLVTLNNDGNKPKELQNQQPQPQQQQQQLLQLQKQKLEQLLQQQQKLQQLLQQPSLQQQLLQQKQQQQQFKQQQLQQTQLQTQTVIGVPPVTNYLLPNTARPPTPCPPGMMPQLFLKLPPVTSPANSTKPLHLVIIGGQMYAVEQSSKYTTTVNQSNVIGQIPSVFANQKTVFTSSTMPTSLTAPQNQTVRFKLANVVPANASTVTSTQGNAAGLQSLVLSSVGLSGLSSTVTPPTMLNSSTAGVTVKQEPVDTYENKPESTVMEMFKVKAEPITSGYGDESENGRTVITVKTEPVDKEYEDFVIDTSVDKTVESQKRNYFDSFILEGERSENSSKRRKIADGDSERSVGRVVKIVKQEKCDIFDDFTEMLAVKKVPAGEISGSHEKITRLKSKVQQSLEILNKLKESTNISKK